MAWLTELLTKASPVDVRGQSSLEAVSDESAQPPIKGRSVKYCGENEKIPVESRKLRS